MIEAYAKASGFYRTYGADVHEPKYSGSILELDLNTVVPCVSGPKRPHDRVPLTDMRNDFTTSLTNQVGFKGFGLNQDSISDKVEFNFKGQNYHLQQGSVVIAAITSCTNTSNTDVMIAAGILAKNAIEKGLNVAPYIKTSLSPGSGVVTKYFEVSGVNTYLDQLGFTNTGYGCMTCIGNSGDLSDEVTNAINSNKNLVVASVLSGNRNFEGRVHPLTRANYLASPPLVVAYALAGRVDIDFESEPIGLSTDG